MKDNILNSNRFVNYLIKNLYFFLKLFFFKSSSIIEILIKQDNSYLLHFS